MEMLTRDQAAELSILVECYNCGVQPYTVCRNASGHVMDEPHDERITRFVSLDYKIRPRSVEPRPGAMSSRWYPNGPQDLRSVAPSRS